MSKRPVKMCVVTAQASTVEVLYRGQLEYLTHDGFDITIVCAPTDAPQRITNRGLAYHPLAIRREISPIADLRAVHPLTRFLRERNFDLLQACTPKGSLIGVAAAARARVPVIVHLLRGLAYQRQIPWRKWLLKSAARLSCRRAHRVIAVGRDLRQLAIDDRLCPAEKIIVLGHGSSNGVDLERFSPARRSARAEQRGRLGIPQHATVIGFVGRLTNDKGIRELLAAFQSLRQRHESAWLLMVGSYEQRDRPPADIAAVIRDHPGIRHVEWTDDVVPMYAAMDLVALPTYREGFNNVILEAAAMGLPVVTSDTIGCREGVVANESGLLTPVADAHALAAAIERLLANDSLRRRFGETGRQHVERHFDRRDIWPLYVDEYRRLFHSLRPDLCGDLIPFA